jgi:hypothetical protein
MIERKCGVKQSAAGCCLVLPCLCWLNSGARLVFGEIDCALEDDNDNGDGDSDSEDNSNSNVQRCTSRQVPSEKP